MEIFIAEEYGKKDQFICDIMGYIWYNCLNK